MGTQAEIKQESKVDSSNDDQTIKLRNAELAIRELKNRIDFNWLVPELSYKGEVEQANRAFQKDKLSE